jgi:RNA polymerase sigma-70 factor (ECF subfamily)
MAVPRASEPELSAELIARAQHGDRAAQEAFLRRYVRPLHALVRRSGAPGDPDDLTQELLSRLLTALPRFDPAGPARLTTWVFTVAQRWLIDERRRRHLTLVELEDGVAVPDSRPLPEQRLEEHRLAVALEDAVGRLPETQRRVFLLAQVHEQPLEAVAEAEGVPLGTVKSRLHRARAQLVLWLGPLLGREEKVSHGAG